MKMGYPIYHCRRRPVRGIRWIDFARLALIVPAAFYAAYLVARVAFNF